ncbi:zinc finger protein 385D-like isoform X2 [Scleropages formosus]|uniref:zinc finger protein 385D-like isoform X2 n=1 Tax=Scleropages formosus TaxID=113540 RepID=UPI0010FA921E|nr:zinc finger protein 385D-like isoform X2 [Scleropages formosus]
MRRRVRARVHNTKKLAREETERSAISFPCAINNEQQCISTVVGVSPPEQTTPRGSWKTGLTDGRACVGMDPVQKAIINHTFGLPLAPKRKPVVVCTVCRLKFNSESQASAHYKGTKHAKKLKTLEAPSSKQKAADAVARDPSGKDSPKSTSPPHLSSGADKTASDGAPCAGVNASRRLPSFAPSLDSTAGTASLSPPASSGGAAPCGSGATGGVEAASDPAAASPTTSPPAETSTETEEEKAKRLLYCSLCKVAVNSASQLEAHNSGAKHKTMLEARSGGGAIKSFPRPGIKSRLASPSNSSTGLQNKTFHCEICDVHVNSETQLKQHISSRRHKDRAAGKPAKPKYSPYTKTPRGPGAQSVRQALRKELELGKPLATRLLPTHLAAAAAAAAAVPAFSLRSAATALFQAQPLAPPLLRAAPGPIRASHAPVLFAPY